MKSSTKLWYLIIALLFFNILAYVTKIGGEAFLLYVSDLLPVLAALIAAFCMFFAFKSFKVFDNTKIAWLILFIGILLNLFAESTYAYLEIVLNKDMDEYFPSLADYFWCLAYPFFFCGLLMMFYGYKKSGFPMGKKNVYIILALGLFVISVALFYLLIVPILNDTDSDSRSKIINIIYPVGDLLVVVLASILMYITSLFGKNSISKPWKYLTYGFILFTIADLVYTYLSWQGLYENGCYIDIAWNLGYLLIGIAGLYQKELIDSLKEKK